MTVTACLEAVFAHPFMNVIREYEGFCAEAYVCPAGYWTIGYGHLCAEGHPNISKEQGDAYLKEDIGKAVAAVLRHAPVFGKPHHLNKLVALTSFVFNVGEGAFKNSTMLRRIKSGKWDAVPAELLRWDKASDPATGRKRRLAGLTRRRTSEATLFSSGTSALA